MNALVFYLPEILLVAMMASAYGLLSLTLFQIVKLTRLFQGKMAVVGSLLMAASAITACALLLLMPNSVTEPEHMRNHSVDFSLLPVLISEGFIVMLMLFIIAAPAGPDRSDKLAPREPARPATNAKLPGRPKKEKPGLLPAAQKLGAKGKSQAKADTAAEGTATT